MISGKPACRQAGGEWLVVSGEWRVESGEWGVGNGKWVGLRYVLIANKPAI